MNIAVLDIDLEKNSCGVVGLHKTTAAVAKRRCGGAPDSSSMPTITAAV